MRPPNGRDRRLGNVEAPRPTAVARRPVIPQSCEQDVGATKQDAAVSVYRFAVGDHVNLWRRRFGKRFWMGEYRITQLLPVERGRPNYRIQGPSVGNQRAASEDVLTKAPRSSASRR